MHDDLARARAESAALLNLDPDRLSPAGALKCDLVSALRLVIDDELVKSTSASGADLGKLIVAVEHLVGFLKESRPPEPDTSIPSIYREDPKKVLEDIVARWIAADEAERAEKGLSPRIHDEEAQQRRIDDLEAELVRLRGPQPHALPSPEAERVIDVPTSAITPPGEQSDQNFRIGVQRTPDDLKTMRPKPTIDGEAVPQTGPTDAEREANRQRINNDRSFEHRIMTQPIGCNAPQPSGPGMPQPDAGGFHWSGSKGRAW
jgi:hypothetical protein